MNNNATIEKMNEMRLHGMSIAFKTALGSAKNNDFTSDEMIAYLIDAEYEYRSTRKQDRLINQAKFRYQAYFEELRFSKSRNLDKNMMLRFSDCNWIKKSENIIITGATGVGKSYLSCALGHHACIHGYKVLYYNCLKLFTELKYAKVDGSYLKAMSKIHKSDLIILDDFGLHPMDNQSSLILLEIFEDRHGRKSIIVSSQLPANKWYEIIGENTLADAICDRIVHQAHKIELQGESLRKKEKS